ncbi:MAG: DUF4147 domain-containing protein [Acidobacteria bacterium]|nr:DUF4147 domain-containing protein [Acidobacteriota bacterium]
MKDQLRNIFLDVLDELSLERVLQERLSCRDGVLVAGETRIDLAEYKKILTVAIGKAAGPMAKGFARLVQPRKASGVIVAPTPTPDAPPYFMTYVGGHPYPTEGSVYAASVVEEMLTDLREQHLVVCLLSGGGSAICEKPVSDEISFEDLREFFRVLVTCGADIVAMNILRKHFSAIKGGRLAERAHPARQLTLYVSDVPPEQPSTVASGPTMPDESTLADCRATVERLGIRERLPASIRAMLDEDRVPETPKPGDAVFANSSWHCLLDNADAIEAVRRRCEALGWTVETDLSVDDLPVPEAADRLLARLKALRESVAEGPVAVLTGGELSSPVLGDGRGGRNSAFVLDCVSKIDGRPIAVISAGTDGVDGNSPAAGALADGDSLRKAREAGLDPDECRQRSDAYSFFDRLGDALETGPTGNNVRDIRLLVAW